MKTYEVKRPAALDLESWDESFHDLMLNDSVRMNAYKKAIQEQVKQGDVVVDLGTGTGILAQWALEAGASKVYGIEFNENTLEIAKDNLVLFGDRFIPVLGNSLNINLPERVDIIISETIGNFADNENCVLFLKDAKKRFLKKDGIMIPQSISQMLVPVYSPKIEDNISAMEQLDYYEAVIPKEDHVASPIRTNLFMFDQDEDIEYTKNESFSLYPETNKITGFKGWFVAQLSGSVNISTETVAEDSSWNNFYFPSAINVTEKDLTISLKRHNGDYEITYKTL
jgi:protein arginine N-methyltransferase 1